MITVLVHEFASGGGFGREPAPPSILAEGRAMRDAACRDLAALPEVQVLAATSAGDVPPVGLALTAAEGETCASFLRRVAVMADTVWLIAPESAGIALELCRVLEAEGRLSLGCNSQAVALASSKSRCLAVLAAAGIDTVPTWPLASAPLEQHALWVLKPDTGCGCESMRRLSSAAAETVRQQAAREGGLDGVIAQPWLEGQAMSLSLLVCAGEAELLSVNRQRVLVAADGALSLAGLDLNLDVGSVCRAELAALARRVAGAVPGLAGFVGVDFILDPAGRPIVLELNPRLTSAYVGLSRCLGRNLAAEVLRCAIPEFPHV